MACLEWQSSRKSFSRSGLQLLLDSETELSNDYRAAVLWYPFTSDPRRTESTNDQDLSVLIDFLARRAALGQQSTPPPEENSNWPEEGEAGPSGSKENPCDSCLGNPSSCTFIRWNAPCFPCIVQMNQDHCIFLNREAFCLRLAQYRDIRSTLLPDIERDAWVAQFYSDCAAAFHLWDHAPIPISSFFAQGIVEYIRPIPITRALAGFDELEKIFNLPSIFTDYPRLLNMVSTTVPTMPKAMIDSLLAISESVAATRYPDRVKQRAFLDEKTVALEGFSTMIPAIARDKSLYDVVVTPTILDLCSRIKTERELNRVGLSAATIAAQQAHRTELEDARVAAEEQAAAEAAATAKPKKSKGKKSKKSKAIVEDIDDEVSVFDDSEFPMTGSGEVDDPMQIDAERVEEGTPLD
ncbi:hypothetical protein B0H14DRAFT_3449650 [Mycena olivaceomarginata]|nr:hypothetical protein B0H14DRAFT_3449650 [Mycena olivaceomarginata]